MNEADVLGRMQEAFNRFGPRGGTELQAFMTNDDPELWFDFSTFCIYSSAIPVAQWDPNRCYIVELAAEIRRLLPPGSRYQVRTVSLSLYCGGSSMGFRVYLQDSEFRSPARA